MGGRNIRSVNNAGGRERRVLTGPAPLATSSPRTPIQPQEILERWENGGVTSFGIRGDGRITLPRFTSTPTSPSDQDFWLEDDGFGNIEIHYQDGGNEVIIGSGGGGGSGSGGVNFSLTPDSTAIQRGFAVRSRLDGSAVKSGFASAGTDSVQNEVYEPIGLLAESIPLSPDPPTDSFRIALPGQPLTLTTAEIDLITGSPELIPSRRYFLSSVPGKWIVDPATASPPLEVVVSVGYALTPTTFLFQPDMAIVL